MQILRILVLEQAAFVALQMFHLCQQQLAQGVPGGVGGVQLWWRGKRRGCRSREITLVAALGFAWQGRYQG